MKKGVALLWTLLIVIIMLIISGTMASYMSKEARMGVNIEESSRAYAFAKSGIDWGVLNAKSATLDTSYCFNLDESISGDDDVCVVVSDKIDGQDEKVIVSTGKANDVVRKIEYIVGDNEGSEITNIVNPPQDTIFNSSVGGSFDFQFDFWTNASSFNGNSRFGLDTGNGSSSPNLYVQFNSDGKIGLYGVDADGNTTTYGTTKTDILADTKKSEFGRYRIKIKYINNNSIALKLIQHNSITNSYTCIDFISGSPNTNYSAFNSFYNGPNTTVYNNESLINVGDGTYISITDGLGKIYIDTPYLTTYKGTSINPISVTIPDLFYPTEPLPADQHYLAIYIVGTAEDSVNYLTNVINGGNSNWQFIPVPNNIDLDISYTAGLNREFSGWGNDCADSESTCVLNGSINQSLIAYFNNVPQTINHLISVVTSGQGEITADGIACGSVNTDCDELYGEGSSVVLTATPVSSYVFSSWGGDCTGSESICTLTNITSAKNITANFVPAEYVPLEIAIKEQGTVTVDGTSLSCSAPSCILNIVKGSNVILNATPADNYNFFRWKEGPCNMIRTPTCNIGILNQGMYVRAEFDN